jgi:hypothetical protein
MELLNISVTVDPLGRVDLDSVVGRDVSYMAYPGPDFLELLRDISAECVSAGRNPASVMPDTLQAVLGLPALLRRLADRVQELIAANEKLAQRQLALFS